MVVNQILAKNCSRASQGSHPYTYNVSPTILTKRTSSKLTLLQECMEVAKAVAGQEGKPEHGLRSGSVWSNTKFNLPAGGSDGKTKTKTPPKTKPKKRGICVNFNNGNCKVEAQGKDCNWEHVCNVFLSASRQCKKNHPAKDHVY